MGIHRAKCKISQRCGASERKIYRIPTFIDRAITEQIDVFNFLEVSPLWLLCNFCNTHNLLSY